LRQIAQKNYAVLGRSGSNDELEIRDQGRQPIRVLDTWRKRISQKAVVTRFLSNREEGLGLEADFYIADWMEARTLSKPTCATASPSPTPNSKILNGLGKRYNSC
jgi:hypothetical protein